MSGKCSCCSARASVHCADHFPNTALGSAAGRGSDCRLQGRDGRRKVYFGAGPARLPECVLDAVSAEWKSFEGTDLSITELSHRSATYASVNRRAQDGLRRLCGFGDDFAVLLMQGGATLQFAAWPYNVVWTMLAENKIAPTDPIDFIISGYWSQKAADEAERLGFPVRRICVVERVKVEHNSGSSDGSGERIVVRLPAIDSLSQIVYYCQNETIDGIELPEIDFKGRTVICDVSSNILSRPINPALYTVIFAGAQKNVGVAGVTIVAVRRSAVKSPSSRPIPLMLDYAVQDASDSVYNTPPVFAVYVTALVVEWLLATFGTLHKVDEYNRRKADVLYSLADLQACPLYAPVQPAIYRSRINIVLRLSPQKHGQEQQQQQQAEAELVERAEAAGFEGIGGHRRAGGLRVSLYNAVTLDDVHSFAAFLNDYFAS